MSISSPHHPTNPPQDDSLKEEEDEGAALEGGDSALEMTSVGADGSLDQSNPIHGAGEGSEVDDRFKSAEEGGAEVRWATKNPTHRSTVSDVSSECSNEREDRGRGASC